MRHVATLGCVTLRTPPAGQGWFITVEGPEGAGKTTQATRMERHLRDRGVSVLRTHEPGGTPLGERLRNILLSTGPTGEAMDPLVDALLFNAARRQLVGDVIRPALLDGTTVVCARFADSTLAYQGYGSGVGLTDLRALERMSTGGLTPDLTILLDLPPELGLGRKAPVDRTRFEVRFDLAFHVRVREGFLALAAAEPDRFVRVDASAPVDDVWVAVEAALERLSPVVTAADEPPRPVERIQR